MQKADIKAIVKNLNKEELRDLISVAQGVNLTRFSISPVLRIDLNSSFLFLSSSIQIVSLLGILFINVVTSPLESIFLIGTFLLSVGIFIIVSLEYILIHNIPFVSYL